MSDNSYMHRFKVMGGPGEIQLFGGKLSSEKICVELCAEATRIEKKFSRFLPDSIISKINAAAGKNFVELDQETIQLINYAVACFNESRGGFDITSGVLRTIWDFKSKVVPSNADIVRVKELIGWGKVLWNPPTIKLPISGMEIDLGGVAKEYAVDRMTAIALNHGVEAGLINLAGDLRTFGKRPDNSSWKIGIRHPRSEGQMIASVEIMSGGLATSGDYERFFEKDGTRYCHIIDPRTGKPIENSFQSVTVQADACLIAGSACTIAMLLRIEDGKNFLDNLTLPYLVVDSHGQISGQREINYSFQHSRDSKS